MSNNTLNDSPTIPHTNPIPITTGRHRSASLSTSIPALSNSPTSTVSSAYSYRQARHVRSSSETSATGGGGGSPTSPLTYFLGAATSPVRTTAGSGFPWSASKTTSAIDEDEESPPGGDNAGIFGLGAHTRRGSWAQAPIINAPGQGSPDRGVGVLRRLSLSSAFQRPTFGASGNVPPAPPPSAVSASPVMSRAVPALSEPRPGRKGRSASLAVPNTGNEGNGKKRGISPMGERLLKGHFDGFI